MDWQPLWLTLQLASITTFLLFLIAIPLAYWLAYTQWRFKVVVDVLVSMPLVLPPTVIGFYLLLLLSPNQGLGQFLEERLGLRFVFSFEGLVLGSVIYSLPFMVQSIQSGFEGLSPNLKKAAYTLGKSRIQTLRYVLLPNMKPALLTGIVLTFAHTIGEFGVVLMIGGNIPGVTRVASIAIYDAVEGMAYQTASNYALVLCLLSFVVLLLTYLFKSRWQSLA